MRLEIWKITKNIKIRKFTKSNPTNLRRHPKTNGIVFWILNWKSKENMTLDYFFIHFLMKFSLKLWNLHFIENPTTIRKARYFFKKQLRRLLVALPEWWPWHLRQVMLTYFRTIVILKVLGNTSHFKNLHERHVV